MAGDEDAADPKVRRGLMRGALRWVIGIPLVFCVAVVVLAQLGGGDRAVPTAPPAAERGMGVTVAPTVAELAAATVAPTRAPKATNTPRPTATPEPSATPEPTRAPLVLTGKGQSATKQFQLIDGLVVFALKHDGERNFIVHLLDGEGRLSEGLVNEIGPVDVSTALDVRDGAYLLDILADGAWSVTVRQPAPNAAALKAPSTIEGRGQTATEFVYLERGLLRVTLKHDGERNFIVHLLDERGRSVDGLVNEIGPFDGSTALRIPSAGFYLFTVLADGRWSIALETS